MCVCNKIFVLMKEQQRNSERNFLLSFSSIVTSEGPLNLEV